MRWVPKSPGQTSCGQLISRLRCHPGTRIGRGRGLWYQTEPRWSPDDLEMMARPRLRDGGSVASGAHGLGLARSEFAPAVGPAPLR